MQPSFSHVAPQLSQALQTWRPARPAEEGVVVVSVPAPRVPTEQVFVAGNSGDAFLWEPSGETCFVAEGVTAEVSASGPERFRVVRDAVQRLLASVKNLDQHPPAPRMFGGFSFQSATPRGALWDGFEAARFVLPRIVYAKSESEAWISLSVTDQELGEPNRVQALIGDTVRWLEGLMVSPPVEPTYPASRRLTSVPDLAGWRQLVSAIKSEIGEGKFQKIVAARRAVSHLNPPPSADQVLSCLAELAEDCTRFAVRRADKLFLGATPELLLKKSGRQIKTEAMAGSRSSRDSDAEAQLLASQKDLGEHALVVDAITSALEQLTYQLHVPETPGVRRLRDILHLHTPINGTLNCDAHVLDLIERLHPTPAVGGTPHSDAHRWIAEHEPEERGWYASPMGWLDAAGDGQFVVALRSALLVGGMAHIFAGAGIVAASDADLEFEETELKLALMINALGAR